MKNKTNFLTPLYLVALVIAISNPLFADEHQFANIIEKSKPLTALDLPHYSQRNIQDEVFYFVLPDRFDNGDKSNDLGSKTKTISRGGFDPKDKKMFHGGDLKGLTQQLSYIENLGITAIWLTPILRNQAVQGDISGYHGYWVLDFTEIDPHLGSNMDLKVLIKEAHKRNIKIFFDIITNHTADVIKLAECHGADGAGWSESGEACPYRSLKELAKGNSYQTVIAHGNEQLKSPAWLNKAKYYHNQGDSTFEGENSLNGDFFGLDDLNTESPTVVSGMTEIYKNIISEFRPDGFRIDTVKHVNIEFWQQFIPELEQHAKQIGIDNFFMFGEVYSGNPKELATFTTKGKLPSVLDFGLQSALYQTLVDQQGTNKLADLFYQDNLYKDADVLLNFSGNHDMGRFASFLTNSQLGYSEQEQVKRFKLAHALLFFVRGIPVIYYGDEQGFSGDGGNHDARQDMMPSKVTSYNDDKLLLTKSTTANNNFNQQHPLYLSFRELTQIYHQHSTLRYGQHKTIQASENPGIYAFSRSTETNEYLVIMNSSTTEKLITLPLSNESYKTIYQTSANNTLKNKKLMPLSFSIYRRLDGKH